MVTKTAEQKAAEKAAKELAAQVEALTDGLKAAGVALTGDETPDQILALADQHGVKVLTPEEAKAAEKAAKNAAKGAVTVKFRDHAGNPTERTFSLEVHGEDFAELAEEFVASNASKIIKE